MNFSRCIVVFILYSNNLMKGTERKIPRPFIVFTCSDDLAVLQLIRRTQIEHFENMRELFSKFSIYKQQL